MSRATFLPAAPMRRRSAVAGSQTALAVRLLLMLLSATALSVSLFLAWLALTGRVVPGCSNEGMFNCDMVLSTRWSKWFNLPVALPAASLYAGLLGLSLFTFGFVPPTVRRGAWRVIAVLAASAALAGIWFIVLQGAIVKHWCPWCLAVHSSGVVIAVLIFAFAAPARRVPLLTGFLAFCCVGLLVVGQLASSTPETFTVEDLPAASSVADASEVNDEENATLHRAGRPVLEEQTAASEVQDVPPVDVLRETPPAESATPAIAENNPVIEETQPQDNDAEITEPAAPQRFITLGRTSQTLDIYQYPILGSPEAEVVVFEMFDYTCHHCRHMSPKIEEARERYGDQLAVVLLPVPMNSACNEYISRTSRHHTDACFLARYALAVWVAKPEAYAAYHHWLMEGDEHPSQSEAQARATAIIGAADFLELTRGEEVGALLGKCVRLYGHVGQGTIPKIIVGERVISGPVNNVENLYEVMEANLPLEPVGQ